MTHRRAILNLILVFALAAPIRVTAAGQPARIRSGLDTEQPVWVGQNVSFHVDLMSATIFSGTPSFDLPPIPGTVLMKIEERPVLGTREIDGVTYSTQRHLFALFAQQPGLMEIPAFTVRFSVPPAFGQPAVEQEFSTEAMKIDVQSPPGTEGSSLVITTTQFKVNQEWTPRLGDGGRVEVKVGDALTRKITLTASELPAMAMPPIPFGTYEGLGVYPKPPTVNDSFTRGDFTGKRVETVVYVCEQPGEVRLPALTIPWWDPEAGELKKANLPATTLFIAPNPAHGSELGSFEGQKSAAEAPPMLLVVGAPLFLLATALLLWRFRHALMSLKSSWQAKRALTEKARFVKLKQTCLSGSAVATYNTLMHWLDQSSSRHSVATIRRFLEDHPNPALIREVKSLERAVLDPGSTWSGKSLVAPLTQARQERKTRSVKTRDALPALNPHSSASRAART